MHPEMGERCRRKYYASLKVKVQHSDTGRITSQTWHLCKFNYFLFLRDQGQGYYTWYHQRPYKKAFAIDYQIIGDLSNHTLMKLVSVFFHQSEQIPLLSNLFPTTRLRPLVVG